MVLVCVSLTEMIMVATRLRVRLDTIFAAWISGSLLPLIYFFSLSVDKFFVLEQEETSPLLPLYFGLIRNDKSRNGPEQSTAVASVAAKK